MAKRNADKELTDRNWDQEEEGEEVGGASDLLMEVSWSEISLLDPPVLCQAGTFSVASQDVLKTRTMKKAKRRSPAEVSDHAPTCRSAGCSAHSKPLPLFQTENSATFKGFKGFSLTSSTPAAFSGFGKGGAFTGLTNGSAPSVGGGATTTSTQAAGEQLVAMNTSQMCVSPVWNLPASSGLMFGSSASDLNGAASRSSASCSSSEYNKQLTALNCSVRDWISKHVDDNPLCDLNPIFRDYERHLASIERQYGAPADAADEDKMADLPPAAPSSSSPAAPLFPFSRGAPEVKPPPGVTFNFGQKVEALPSPPPPSSFSFTSSSHTSLFGGAAAQSSKSEEAPPPTGMAAAGWSHICWTDKQEVMSSGRKSQTVVVLFPEDNEDEEAEEPPRPEVKEVQEKDAFYSRK